MQTFCINMQLFGPHVIACNVPQGSVIGPMTLVLWHCWLGHLTHKNLSLIWPIICLVGH